MLKYIIRRIIAMIPVVIGITFLVFMIMQLAPGDPVQMILGDNASPEAVEAMRDEMGLNDNVLVQYGRYLVNLVQGDMGTSYVNKRPVADEVFSRVPATFKLAAVAAVVSIVIAIPLGILAAIKQNTLFDHSSMVVSLIGISMPAFWLALMLMLLFSLKLGWLPAQGAKDGWKSYVLPSIAIGFMQMAAIARTTRSSMLETIRQDYIRTARSKGITEREVIFHHSFRNALIPTVTIVGVQLGGLLGGAVLTETVFAWPGLGRLVVQAVNGRDVPVVLGCIVVLSVGFSIVNLVVDLLYGFIDPRVRSMYQ
ncbi:MULTISPECIES: nickel ABC transporter permease [Enterocloster]|uniref:Nickel import system permease protein NikB n=2 Tax=Enterocloster TaxID=2719313 RepID=A0A1I0GMK9_9FIRM|nr:MULTISPECIES: nickel ABC transporter permease [Enterocloster]MBS5605075.1 ABC transporter permease [Enterocloster asparagiformis]MCB6343127.1 ABC transporter permease [Enterocloster lavalensis]MDR3755526.1 ABC transporter permease [Enterocloster sp.]SET72463.1 peptide/nickel transport system permease protein [Enterocloster lavalensis]